MTQSQKQLAAEIFTFCFFFVSHIKAASFYGGEEIGNAIYMFCIFLHVDFNFGFPRPLACFHLLTPQLVLLPCPPHLSFSCPFSHSLFLILSPVPSPSQTGLHKHSCLLM